MPLVGKIFSCSGRVPLYAKAEDVPADVTRWALVTDSEMAKGQKALDEAAETFGVEKTRLTVFSAGREGDFWVVSCGYQA